MGHAPSRASNAAKEHGGFSNAARAEFDGGRRIRIVPFRGCRSETVEALVRLAVPPPRRAVPRSPAPHP